MNKARDIKILKYKIIQINTKISNFVKYNISSKKVRNLENLRLKYKNQLTKIGN